MNVEAPNVKNLTRGGAIVMFALTTATAGYLDLGNIPDFSYSTPTNFLEHMTARSGKLIKDRREPTDFQLSFKLGIDELNVANMQLVQNAATPSAFSQSSGTGTSVTITNPILGNSFDLGAYKVTNVVVTVSAATKTLGVDYALEADLGMIAILPTGTILATDTVTVTFNKPALTGDVIAPLTNTASIQGPMKIYFRTSDGRLWCWKHTTAQIAFTGDTALTGNAFGKSQAELLVMPDYTQASPFGTMTVIPGP